jgi:hypothetical protein
MRTIKALIGTLASLWALAALLTIPKCLHHLNDATHGPIMKGILIAALSSVAAGIVLSTVSFRGAFRKN